MKKALLVLTILGLMASTVQADDLFTYQEVVRMGNPQELQDLFRVSSGDVEMAADAAEGAVALTIKNLTQRTLYLFTPSIASQSDVYNQGSAQWVDVAINLSPFAGKQPLIIPAGQTVNLTVSAAGLTSTMNINAICEVADTLQVQNGELIALQKKNLLF